MNPRIWSLLAALALSGCASPTSPIDTGSAIREGMQTPAHLESAASDVRARPARLSTSAEAPRTVAAGSVVLITLTLTSHEREPLTLYFSTSCQLQYHVYDVHGTPVDECCGCFFLPTALTIGPGETVRRQIPFRAVRYEGGEFIPLPPGVYRIQAFLARHRYSDPSLEPCLDHGGCYSSPPFLVRLLEQQQDAPVSTAVVPW